MQRLRKIHERVEQREIAASPRKMKTTDFQSKDDISATGDSSPVLRKNKLKSSHFLQDVTRRSKLSELRRKIKKKQH